MTVGRIVIYRLTVEDSRLINSQRTCAPNIAKRITRNTDNATFWPLGAQAHIGTETFSGEEYPMIVTRLRADGLIAGQVFLDGNDTFWAAAVSEGPEKGQWHWPAREAL